MFKTIKRYAAILLALLICLGAVSVFVSCDETPSTNPDETLDDVTDGGEVTEAPDVTEAPVVDLGDFEITTEVKIIRPDKCDDSIKAAAEALAKAVQEHLGFTCRVSTDWNDRVGAEIMIGNCARRADSVEFNDIFYPEGYGYAVLTDGTINISAHNVENVYRAVKLFIDNVISKKTTVIPVGTENLKRNEKPDVSYSINGQSIDSFVIVADDVTSDAAVNLKNYIDDSLLSKLDVVTPAEYKSGNAIVIGSFGTVSHGFRFKISSKTENGNVVVTLDGESDILQNSAFEMLRDAFMSTNKTKAEFVVPESIYGYRNSSMGGTKLYLTSSEAKELAEGVTYYKKTYNNYENKNVDVFITVVSGDSKAQFGTYVADFDTGSGKDKLDVKTVGVLAAAFESTGVNVLAACNAGYFHKAAGSNYPYGMRIVKGVEVWAPNGDDVVHSDNWVGITFDGKMVCGNARDYESTYEGKLEYGVACGSYIMKDGKVKMQRSMTGTAPFTAIALTADGGFVIIAVDGRPENGKGTSEGASAFDIVTLLWDLDLEYTDAYILDGGGSTEMVVENGKYFYTQNSPSDMSSGKRGKSRPVSDIIAVIIP